MIDCIDSYSNEYGLTINLSKTKVVVFRNRGIVKDDEKLILNGESIDMCDEFIYLGILFKYNGNVVHTEKLLAKQGRKALFQLYNRIHEIVLIMKLHWHCLILIYQVF